MEDVLERLESKDTETNITAIKELINIDSTFLPVGNITRLFRIISENLNNSNNEILNYYMDLLEKIIPDFGPEIETLFIPLISKIIDLLTKPNLGEKALRLFELYTYKTKNLENVLKILVPQGIHGDNWALRVESLKMCILLIEIDPTFLESVSQVTKLMENVLLRVKDESSLVKTTAIETTKRINELVENPQYIINRLSKYYQDIYNAEIGPSRPKITIHSLNDMLFGFVPNDVIRQIENKEDIHERVEGMQALEQLVIDRYDFESIKGQMPSFARFLNRVLPETNVNLIQPTLEIIKKLQSVSGSGIVIQFLPNLMYKLGNEKHSIRQATFTIFKGLVRELGARCLVPHLMKGLESTNWHIREETMHIFVMCMLLRNDYNFLKLSIFIARLLEDAKTKISFVANEVLAMIAVQSTTQRLLDNISDLLDEKALSTLQTRIDLRQQPILHDDFIEYPRIKTAHMSPPMVETPPIFAVRKRKKIDVQHLTTDNASPPVVKNAVNHNEVTHNLRLLKSKANWKQEASPSPAKRPVAEKKSPPVKGNLSTIATNPIKRNVPIENPPPAKRKAKYESPNPVQRKAGQGGPNLFQKEAAFDSPRHVQRQREYEGPKVIQRKARQAQYQSLNPVQRKAGHGSPNDIQRKVPNESPRIFQASVAQESPKQVRKGRQESMSLAQRSPQNQSPKQLLHNRSNKTVFQNPNQNVNKSFHSGQKQPGPPPENTSNTLSPLKKRAQNAKSSNSFKTAHLHTEQTTYQARSELQQVENAPEALESAIGTLKTKNWGHQFDAITTIRSVVKFQPKAVFFHLKNLIGDVLELSDSLRSSLSKHALILLGEICKTYGSKKLTPHLQDMITLLLKKSADTNIFISEQAQQSSSTLCKHCNAFKTLTAILQILVGQKNPNIRSNGAQMIALTIDRMEEKDMDRYVEFVNLWKSVYRLTSDSSEEVRTNAKIALQSIARKAGLDKCESMLSKELDAKEISKFVKIAREEGSPMRTIQKPPKSAGKTTIKRPTLPISKSAGFNKALLANSKDDLDLLERVGMQLQNATWQKKHELLNMVVELVNKYQDLVKKTKARQVISLISRCLIDLNTKVALHALHSLQKILPVFGNALEKYLNELIQALAGNLASTNSGVRNTCLEVFQTLMESAEPGSLVLAIWQTWENSNQRARTPLILILNQLIPHIKTSIIYKNVLPICYKLLDESKPDLRAMASNMIVALYEVIGPTLIEMAPGKKAKRIIEILNKV